jgi:hypothetical protein
MAKVLNQIRPKNKKEYGGRFLTWPSGLYAESFSRFCGLPGNRR